jgi:hypothetical protein
MISGCQYFQPREEAKEPVIARVGDKELLQSDLRALMPVNLSKTDSAAYSEKFVLEWVKKQLMIRKAEEAIDFNEARIQNKVLDYQYALMVHELEKKYIDANLNEDVSEEEIRGYYEEKSENFILRENLAKCLYFKVPAKAPNVWRLRRALRNYPKDSVEVWEYAQEYAVKSFTEDTVWVKFDEVLMETPLKDVNDKAAFLRTNQSVEVSDADFIYFLKILDHKTIGEVAPLEFIRESIKDIIINKRKIALKKELERKTYEEAKKTNTFEIYRD